MATEGLRITQVTHRELTYWKVDFVYDTAKVAEVKKLKGARWSKTHNAWLVLPTRPNSIGLRRIFNLPPLIATQAQEHLLRYKTYLEAKRMSPSTVKSYVQGLSIFLLYFKDKNPSEITDADAQQLFHEYAHGNNISISYQRLLVNAIKHFYTKLEDRKLNIDKLVLPRKARVLPNVLSKEEVQAILRAPENLKHKAML